MDNSVWNMMGGVERDDSVERDATASLRLSAFTTRGNTTPSQV
jgi:hypothetical protein